MDTNVKDKTADRRRSDGWMCLHTCANTPCRCKHTCTYMLIISIYICTTSMHIVRNDYRNALRMFTQCTAQSDTWWVLLHGSSVNLSVLHRVPDARDVSSSWKVGHTPCLKPPVCNSHSNLSASADVPKDRMHPHLGTIYFYHQNLNKV